jgi:hypothetical protein
MAMVSGIAGMIADIGTMTTDTETEDMTETIMVVGIMTEAMDIMIIRK